jgi:hypothetical protein
MIGVMAVYLPPLDRSTIYSISSCVNHPAATFSRLNMSFEFYNVKEGNITAHLHATHVFPLLKKSEAVRSCDDNHWRVTSAL